MTTTLSSLDARRFDPPPTAAWMPARDASQRPRSSADETTASTDANPPRRLASAELLAGSPEVLIEHGESTYRLRLTALGKLILTK